MEGCDWSKRLCEGGKTMVDWQSKYNDKVSSKADLRPFPTNLQDLDKFLSPLLLCSTHLEKFLSTLLLYSTHLEKFLSALLLCSIHLENFLSALLLYSTHLEKFLGALLLCSTHLKLFATYPDYRKKQRNESIRLNSLSFGGNQTDYNPMSFS